MNRLGLFLSFIKKLTINETVIINQSFSEKDKNVMPDFEYIKKVCPANKSSLGDYDKAYEDLVRTEKLLEQNSIGYITFLDREFPSKLRNIKQCPKVLYYKGDIGLLQSETCIGVVGTRKPSSYGIWAAAKLSAELSQHKICIISGMALGIDSIAHKCAVEQSGKTVCVLGSSIDKPYPKMNIKLMQSVVDAGGLIITEYPPGSTTLPVNFAYRNRIISALSQGILIIEAGLKSGTLITADFALEQGKSIFAVPGNIDSSSSKGTNALIKQGAMLVTSVSDILSEFDIKYVPSENSKLKAMNLSQPEYKIYECISEKGLCHAEYISLKTNINISDVIGVLNIMDIKGIVNYDGFMVSLV